MKQTPVCLRLSCRRTAPLLVMLAGLSVPSSARPSPTPYLTLTQSAVDAFGYTVSPAGDLNADGSQDVIVGAPGNAYGSDLSTGRAYVFFGGEAVDSVADVTLRSLSPSIVRGFGTSVAGHTDLNGDGYPDIAVGSPYDDTNVSGRVYLYWGGANFRGIPDVVLGDQAFPPGFGRVVSFIGDINHDGYGDLLVGSFGASYVFFGGPKLDTAPDLKLPASMGIEDAAALGDIDLDGNDDFIVGTGTGAVLYRGGAYPDSIADLRFSVPSDGRAFGYSAAAGGDLDGDGQRDLVIGAPGALSPIVPPDEGALPPGRVYVYRGGSVLDTTPDYVLEGSADGDEFGAAVAVADVTGDNLPELLVGAPGSFGFPLGTALIFQGGPNFRVLEQWSMANSDLGTGVAAGDLNGDRVADVIVSQPGLGPVTDGAVYVYNLGATLPARAFVQGDHRVLALSSAPSSVCFWLEAVGGSFQNEDLSVGSFRLLSQATGSVSEIAAVPSKELSSSDADRNGVPDVRICFDRGDLRRLLSSIRGRREVELTLKGGLATGQAVEARFRVTVLGLPVSSERAIVSPNPMNPGGRMEFTLRSAAAVTVRIYDVRGRCIRTVLDGAVLSEGVHSVDLDARDDQGRLLASGIYHYQLTRGGETARGSFVVAK